MRKIDKGAGPQSLMQWKRHHQNSTYKDLPSVERQDIRSSCLEDQFYLCAYCCQSITGKNNDCMNEHVVTRSIAPNRSLDFSNIVASCTTPRQCDAAHKLQPFALTPFMNECETEFKFKISGRVEGLTDRAIETIKVLKLMYPLEFIRKFEV